MSVKDSPRSDPTGTCLPARRSFLNRIISLRGSKVGEKGCRWRAGASRDQKVKVRVAQGADYLFIVVVDIKILYLCMKRLLSAGET